MTVTVYTLPECIQCDLTKRAFERRGVEFEEVELTEESLQRFKEQGALSAPIVVTPGLWWYGLKPDLIHQTWKEQQRDRVGGPEGHHSS